MAGLVSEKIGLPTKIAAPSVGENTLGLILTNTNAEMRPDNIAEIAPAVLNRFQKIV